MDNDLKLNLVNSPKTSKLFWRINKLSMTTDNWFPSMRICLSRFRSWNSSFSKYFNWKMLMNCINGRLVSATIKSKCQTLPHYHPNLKHSSAAIYCTLVDWSSSNCIVYTSNLLIPININTEAKQQNQFLISRIHFEIDEASTQTHTYRYIFEHIRRQII